MSRDWQKDMERLEVNLKFFSNPDNLTNPKANFYKGLSLNTSDSRYWIQQYHERKNKQTAGEYMLDNQILILKREAREQKLKEAINKALGEYENIFRLLIT